MLVAVSLVVAATSTFVTLLPPWVMSLVIDEVAHAEQGRISRRRIHCELGQSHCELVFVRRRGRLADRDEASSPSQWWR